MSEEGGAGPARLEAGWGAVTPAGDNLVHSVLHDLADCFGHFTRTLGGREERREGVALCDLGSREPLFNDAVLFEPVLDGQAPVLDEVDTFYGDDRGTGAIVWSAWPTPDLTGRGWELVGHPPLMLLSAGHAGTAPTPPPELAVEKVVDAAGVAALEQVLVRGFPLVGAEPYEPGTLFDDRVLGGNYHMWIGRVDGRAVAASAAYVSNALVLVEWVATLPEARGHGYGAALTWEAATCAPDRHAVLHSSDAGQSIYVRMGFLSLLRFTLWHRPGPSSRTP